MKYYSGIQIKNSFDKTLEIIEEELKKEGFGILTRIDVKNTLKNKLDVDFRRYMILGACNPEFAFQALTNESNIGTLLPCNVVVQELADGRIEVSAVEPVVSMKVINNPVLDNIAGIISKKLKNVIGALSLSGNQDHNN